jgi:hypothetical protein
METRPTSDGHRAAVRPAHEMAGGFAANGSGDAAGMVDGELSDLETRLSEDAVTPIGGPEYTGRA